MSSALDMYTITLLSGIMISKHIKTIIDLLTLLTLLINNICCKQILKIGKIDEHKSAFTILFLLITFSIALYLNVIIVFL